MQSGAPAEGGRLCRVRAGNVCLIIAACFGCVHAGFSLYWAAGGTWLLETVGQWAVQAAADGGLLVTGGLATIGVLKLIVAVTPVLGERLKVGSTRRWIRAASWLGAAALVGYGGLNTAVAALVLTGTINPDGGYDRNAMVGHAFIWDPLFLLWGAALALGLVLTRRVRDTADS